MKKVQLFLVFLILLNFVSFSQNWRLISINDSYNYSIDSVDYISHTIKIDSVELVENDSVFYLNRIMTNCDTCANNQYNDFALRNQPQFLMRKMIKVSDSLYIFQDTSEFRIMPLKKFGESWLFDEENNITAAVSYAIETEIFGIPDSLKNISLSNGNKIKISKNFGIIEFPADNNSGYELVGIEGGREFGESLPNFNDFFEYDVGDIFQRRQYGYGIWSWIDIYKKYEILTKEINNNSIIYDISGWNLRINVYYDVYNNLEYDTTAFTVNETIILTDSVEHLVHKYPNELTSIAAHHSWWYSYELMLRNAEISSKNGRYSIKVGSFCNEPGEPCEFYPYFYEESPDSDLLIRNYDWGPGEIEIKYTAGLGYDYNMFWFEETEGDTFMGKIHNGDTIGIVYPDSFFEQYSGINKVNSNNLKIYPNPTKDIFYIDSGNYTVRKISILDITGKYLFEKNVIQHFESMLHTLDLSDFKKGIYIVSVQTDHEIMTSKIIKN